MNRATQGLLLTITGTVLLRIAIGDTYLRYVNTWMRWPLIACGLLLLALSLSDLLPTREDETAPEGEERQGEHVPRAAWLLFVPSLVVFLIAPPALGAYYAERAQSAPVPAEGTTAVDFPPLPATDPAPVQLQEFVIRAAYDTGATLVGRQLEITGFVSQDKSGRWYVSQFGINCCAADATVTRVIADGREAPPDDQWVRVVGTCVEGTGANGTTLPELSIDELALIDAPKNQYR